MKRCKVCIVGDPADVARTFESRPRTNPPLETYYRRIVYQIALQRLADIAEAIRQGETHATGKAFRDEQGNVIGRGKGVMPSIGRTFPEVKDWDKGPALLRKTILEAKSPLYFTLLQAAADRTEHEQGEQLERFVKDTPRRELEELPPVQYPAHKGTKKCRHCRRPHSSALHRFHLRGSFDATHPGREEARHRKRERAAGRERWQEEIPF